MHRKHDVPKRFDVAFVGNACPGPRAELLDLIRRKYPNSFLGQAYFDEMARTYSAARMAFNRSIKNDVNMRAFEAIACGSLLVINDLAENGQDELLRHGVHLATYREPEDLLDKLAFYLEREEVRERIAAAGRSEVIEKHTYRNRMERLLLEAEAGLGRVVVGSGSANGVGLHATEPGDLRSGTRAGSGDPHRTESGDLRSGTRAGPGDHCGEYLREVIGPAKAGTPTEDSARSCWSTAFRRNQVAIDGPAEAGTPTSESLGFRGNRGSARCSPQWSGDPRRTQAPLTNGHDPFYFGHARPEVMALVPVGARRILDIGCGAGRLGEALKTRQQAKVVGIELDEAAAAVAGYALIR